MAFLKNNRDTAGKLVTYRRFLLIAAGFYFFWWFFVHWIFPQDFNPILSRLFIVAGILTVWCLTFSSQFVKQQIRIFFEASCWAITLHYFYLFYGNKGSPDWVTGAYITVIAITLLLNSVQSLLAYSGFVMILSLALGAFLPPLKHSVFLPGMFTVVFLANIGNWVKLKVLNAVTESRNQFQLLFNSAFEGVLVHVNRCILDVNEPLAKMFEYEKAELVGRDALCMIHPNERPSFEKRIEEHSVYNCETVGITKSGTLVEIELSAKNFTYGQVPARLVTFQDIGDRKRAEREKIEAQTLAERLRVQDEFISIASHELKTPLTSLLLQTQNMERAIKKDDPQMYTKEKIKNFASILSRQSIRLNSLIDAMLDVSRISQGKVTLEKEKLDFSKLLAEVVTLQQSPLIDLNLSEDIFVAADRYRLEQVIENLIGNALKYGSGNRVSVTLQTQGNMAQVTVEDRGIGIDPESMKRIFNRFERGLNVKNISGLGLGLYISRQITEAHGGTISVESKLGVGSKFVVILPIFTEN